MAMGSSLNFKARSLPTASLGYSPGMAQARIASRTQGLGGFSYRKVEVLQRISYPGVIRARSVAVKQSCGQGLRCSGRGTRWQGVRENAEMGGLCRVRAMAEDSSETTVATEDRQVTPEEEEDQYNVREILRVVELLKKKRDMSFAEVKLTIMIEDPRDVERRRQLGIEDERGCSREDMAIALVEVYEGRMPQDRLVLRELTKEMLEWPNLEDEITELNPAASPYAKATPTGVDPLLSAKRARVDWDAAAEIQPGEQKDLSDMVPPAVGFSLLYIVSFIPVIIVVVVVAILFFNSLQ